jgi:hypothetical protein
MKGVSSELLHYGDRRHCDFAGSQRFRMYLEYI